MPPPVAKAAGGGGEKGDPSIFLTPQSLPDGSRPSRSAPPKGDEVAGLELACHRDLARVRLLAGGRSGDGPVEEVPVLRDRSREDGEVDLAVVIDCDDPDHGPRLAVTGEEHRPGADASGGDGILDGRPAQGVVILGVEVGYEIKVVHGSPARSGQFSWYGFTS